MKRDKANAKRKRIRMRQRINTKRIRITFMTELANALQVPLSRRTEMASVPNRFVLVGEPFRPLCHPLIKSGSMGYLEVPRPNPIISPTSI